MERIVKVGDYEIPLKSNAASLFVYKAQFGRDAMKDLLTLAKAVPNGEFDMASLAESGLDIDLLYRFLWVFAKAANPSIPPLVEWLAEFDVAPFEFMQTVLPPALEVLMSTAQTGVPSKNHPAAGRAEK